MRELVEDSRMLERVYNLLLDCGAPEIIPQRTLLIELYYMLYEHFEGVEE